MPFLLILGGLGANRIASLSITIRRMQKLLSDILKFRLSNAVEKKKNLNLNVLKAERGQAFLPFSINIMFNFSLELLSMIYLYLRMYVNDFVYYHTQRRFNFFLCCSPVSEIQDQRRERQFSFRSECGRLFIKASL